MKKRNQLLHDLDTALKEFGLLKRQETQLAWKVHCADKKVRMLSAKLLGLSE